MLLQGSVTSGRGSSKNGEDPGYCADQSVRLHSSQSPVTSALPGGWCHWLSLQWTAGHLTLAPPRGGLQPIPGPQLTFNSEALPVLVSCFNFSEATALLYFPAGSGLLFSRSFLRFSFSFIFICFLYFFFLLSRFLSVAVFSAAVFISPALFFSYSERTTNILVSLTPQSYHHQRSKPTAPGPQHELRDVPEVAPVLSR